MKIVNVFMLAALLSVSTAVLATADEDAYVIVTGTLEVTEIADDGEQGLQVVTTDERIYRLHPTREVLHHTPLGRKVQVRGVVEVTEVGEFLSVEEITPIDE